MSRRGMALVQTGFGIAATGSIALLVACSQTAPQRSAVPHAPPPAVEQGTAAPAPGAALTEGGYYKIGTPYRINGVLYRPAVDESYDEVGIASWYGPGFHGKLTANGERYDQNALTAAHPTLPMPSLVRVTNLDNGRAVTLRINDRGPFARGRILDVSRRGAQLLGIVGPGTARVRVSVLAEESRRLAALARQGVIADPERVIAELARDRAGEATRLAAAPHAGTAAPLFIQAGAFADRERARRLKATLTGIAPTALNEAVVGSQRLYRVRLGPLADQGEADRVLAAIAAAGVSQARLVND